MNNNSEINAFVTTSIERFSTYFTKDLLAISEENATKESEGGLTSPIHLVGHCAGLYIGITALLKTGSMPQFSDEDRAAFLAKITNREEAVKAFDSAKAELLKAVEEFPSDNWHEPVEGFFGPTKLAAASFAFVHTMYHDGQLNHLHLIDGDKQMHWFS